MPDALTLERSSQSLTEDTAQTPRYGIGAEQPGPLMEPLETVDPETGERMPDYAAHKRVARAAMRLWQAHDGRMRPLLAQWKVNSARRQGIAGARLIRDPDDHWTAWFPRNATPDTAPDFNKAAALCRKFPSLMFTDPPAPIVEPPSGEDKDIEAAEFSTRVLVDLQSESQLDTVRKARDAFDKASEFGSGFIRYYVDERGGGRGPVEIEAHPLATHVDNALIDPEVGIERGPYVTRYVRPDGTLTDNPAEAAQRWIPVLRSEVLTGRHVRPIPHTAQNIAEAHGAQCASFPTWRELEALFPEIANLPKEIRTKIEGFRPEYWEDLIPGTVEAPAQTHTEREHLEADTAKDPKARRVFVLTTYYEVCAEYPEGLYLITLGDCYVAHRDRWAYERPDGTLETLLVPIAQFAQWREGRDGFYGVGSMEILGGPNEVRAAQIAHLLDHLDKVNRRKVFVPTSSIIDPKQLQLPRQTVIPVNPGGEPKYEDIPDYPRAGLEAYGLMGEEMDNSLGLAEAAQGLQDPSVQSGRHAYAIISQVHAVLSEPRQAIERGYRRACRIELQLARAFYPTTRTLRWKGPDGRHQERAWRGADLVATTDVRIQPGTLTMLSPAAKAAFAEHLLELQLITPEQARDIMTTNVGGMIGLQDDPFRMRIRRQLARWDEGPPDGWRTPQEQAPAVPPAPLPPVVGPDPNTGEMRILDPVLAEIWEPVACDLLPDVAQVRLAEIKRFMAGTRYLAHPPEWRAAVELEYQRMLQAAGVLPAQQQPAPAPGGPPPEPRQVVGPEGVPIDAVQEGVPPELAGA